MSSSGKQDNEVRVWCGCTVPRWTLGIYEWVGLVRGLGTEQRGRGGYDPESLRGLEGL